MLIPRSAQRDLARLVPGSVDALRVASVALDVDPMDLVRSGAGAHAWAGFFGSPGGRSVGGLGKAWEVTATGPDRLATISAELRAAGIDPAATALAGFAFHDRGAAHEAWDGFPAATVVLPEIAVVTEPSSSRLVIAVGPGRDGGEVLARLARLERPGPAQLPEAAVHSMEARPAPAAYRDGVAEAVAAIAAGGPAKVVLAREVIVRSGRAPDALGLVHHLRKRHPGCRAFAWQVGRATFLGASPELLIARAGDVVKTHPLAGSAPRGEGDDDPVLGHSLLLSAKDRLEHQLVVDDLVGRLGPITASLTVPAVPSVRRLATVQHLSTEISGTLAEPHPVLELAGLVHPSPAVGGSPREEALAYIDKIENFDRGWYAGGVGWCSPNGDGEVALAIRCGLVEGSAARLYAGAGIVAGSRPEAELEETRLKLRPLLDLLAAT